MRFATCAKVAMKRVNDGRLKSELDRVLERYQRADYLDTDPVSVPHQFTDPLDQEMTAFLAAMMAFGNVRSMLPAIQQSIGWLGSSPVSALKNCTSLDIEKETREFRYRWLKAEDMAAFLGVLKSVYSSGESLEILFMRGFGSMGEVCGGGISSMLAGLRERLSEEQLQSYGTRYLLPAPGGKGAYKRVHLFLRWMIRHDAIDLGLWKGVGASACLIPVDTHVDRISKLLGLTQRSSVDGKMATEITDALRRLDPADPVKYDFAITRLGILGACPRRPVHSTCMPCDLRACCKHWAEVGASRAPE